MFLSKKDDELNELERQIKRKEEETSIMFSGDVNNQEDIDNYMQEVREYLREIYNIYDNK